MPTESAAAPEGADVVKEEPGAAPETDAGSTEPKTEPGTSVPPSMENLTEEQKHEAEAAEYRRQMLAYEQEKAKYDAAMNEFERAMEKMSKSMRKSAVQSIREDERMRQSAREMLIHVARARVAAHGAASISLARTDQEAATATTTARRKSLQDISLVSGAAAKVALDRSVERMRRDKHANETSAERAAREAAEAAERKDQQPVFEHLEACTRAGQG